MINTKAALIALFLIFLSACSEPTIYRDELVERNGVLYEKFATTPFNGQVIGQISGALEDGRWDGKVYEFNEEGNLSKESTYVRGVKEGVETIYSRGRRVQEKTFAKGDLRNFKRYFNGLIQINENYKNENKHGVQEFFWDNGNLMYRANYDSGELLEDILDVYSNDALTHLEVPVTHDAGGYLVADGIVKIVGDESCGVEYDKGRDPILKVALEPIDSDPRATERNREKIRCTDIIGTMIANTGLTSLLVEGLFPIDD